MYSFGGKKREGESFLERITCKAKACGSLASLQVGSAQVMQFELLQASNSEINLSMTLQPDLMSVKYNVVMDAVGL